MCRLPFSFRLLIVFLQILFLQSDAFQIALLKSTRCRPRQGTCGLVLSLSHGFSGGKAKNKQAALRQKVEDAKRQKQEEKGNAGLEISKCDKSNLSDKEIRERNDRLRFEELLKKGTANILNDFSSDGYLNREQEEEEIDAVRKCSCFIVLL